ncbi:Toxin subunit [Madurella fahalii]|uniref:Toxin subunit n=1 Tax=Madurella fahalii TaxID=1157608 RepID=A0ABQ0G3K0_9PEZI
MSSSAVLQDAARSLLPENTALAEALGSAIDSEGSLLSAVDLVLARGDLLLDDVRTLQWIKTIISVAAGNEILAAFLLQQDPASRRLASLALNSYYSGELPAVGGDVLKRFRANLGQKEPLAVLLASIKAGELLGDNDPKDAITLALSYAVDKEVGIGAPEFSGAVKEPNFFASLGEGTVDPDQVLNILMKLQRLQCLVTEPSEINQLREARFYSAHDIASQTKESFVRAMRGMDRYVACKIHDNAVIVDCRNEVTWVNILTTMNEDFLATKKAAASLEDADAGRIPVRRAGSLVDEADSRSGGSFLGSKRSFNMTEIFDLQATPCSECNSITSASAYFVDLLKFLEQSRCDPSKAGFHTLLQALSDRRPDLQELKLSCANSKNVIPYIAIVNEIMESFIASQGGTEGTAALQVVNEEDDDGGGGSGKAAALGEQTTKVFQDQIATQMHPLKFFPYNQGLDAAKVYLSALDISFFEMSSTFKSTACLLSQFVTALPDDQDSRDELLREADAIWHRADVANTLGFLPLDFSAVSRENIYTAQFLDSITGLASGDAVAGPLSQVLTVPGAHQSWGYADPSEMLSEDEDEQTGLCFIRSQLLPRSGLSFEELIDITNTTYFGRRLIITNVDKSKVFNGQLAEMRLRSLDTATRPPAGPDDDGGGSTSLDKAGIGPLTEQLCHELQSFIRLKNKLGWPIHEVDVAIASLTENHVANCVVGSLDDFRGITYRLLEDLSYLIKLSSLTNMSPSSILPLWAQINSRGKNSLYQKVFLSPIRFLSDDSVFQAGPSGTYFETSDAIENHISALTMALKLGNEDLDNMMTATGIKSNTELSMDVLSKLYRHTLLCRMLDVRPKDYLATLSVLPHPNPFFDPKTTLDAVKAWRQLRDNGWSTAEILLAASQEGRIESELLPVSDAALGLTAATAEKLDSLEKTWNPRLLGGVVTSQDVLDLCNQLFDAATARSIALLVEGLYSTSRTLSLDPSLSFPPPATRPILPDKLIVKTNRQSTGDTSVTVTVTGLLSDKEKAKALEIIGESRFIRDAVEEVDKLSKIPYQALLSSLSGPADEGIRESIMRLLVLDPPEGPTSSEAPLPDDASEEQEEKQTEAALKAEKQLRIRRADFVTLLLPALRARVIEDLAVRFIGDKISGVEPTILPVLLHQEKRLGGPGSEASKPGEPSSAIFMLRRVQYLSDTRKDLKSGYFRPSATDWYTFGLPSPSSSSSSGTAGPDLFINGRKLDLKHDGRGWSSDRIMMTNGQSYLLASSVPLSEVRWETKQSASSRFTNTTILDQDSVTTVGSVLARVSRAAYLVKKLELSLEELKYFSTPGGLVAFHLDALTLQDMCRLDSYRQLRDSVAKDPQSLIGLFGWLADPNDDTPDLASRLAAATTWPKAQLTTALMAKYTNMKPADVLRRFRSLDEFTSLQAVMEVSGRIRPAPGKEAIQPLLTLFRVAMPSRPGNITKDFTCADDLRMLLRPRQLSECTAKLRETQRTALVEYLLQQPYVRSRELFDADALFEYFLVDVQMGAMLEITRMKQAISTVQLYMQRCLLGLEVNNGVSSSHIDQSRWLWMQKHNVWTATRKAVLYPENWIDPTLRDDKTPLFADFETTIMQKDLNWETFSGAIRTYVQGLSGVSDLDIVAYLRQHQTASAPEIYHFFGRTRSAPFRFYYRSMRLSQPNNVVWWSPWTLIEMDTMTYEADWDGTTIAYCGSYLLPVVRGNRLLLYLPQIMIKTLTPGPPQKADEAGQMQPISYAEDIQRVPHDMKTASPKNWEIRMAWTELLNGQWTPKRVSQAALVVDWDPSFTKEPLPSLARFTFQCRTSNNAVAIHVGCWRNEKTGGVATTEANSHSLGTFLISEDRVVANPYSDPRASTQTTLPTAFQKFSWDSEAARPGAAQVDVPSASVAPFGTGSPLTPLLAVPSQSIKRRLVWTLSYNANDELSAASGLVVEEQPGDGASPRSIFMYPELTGMTPKKRAELASHNLLDNAKLEVVEHQYGPRFMQAISESDDLEPLLAVMADIPVTGYGKAVVQAGLSSYYELATSYALYNWELGMHCVLMAVDRFLATQQFELALRAARLVFDPTVDAVGGTAEEAAAACWRFPPFRDIARNKAEIYDRFEGWSEGDTALAVAVTERRSNPSSSHASARARPKAYMKWIVMKYIETLIAAGDEYFRQGSLESLPLAIQRYIEAIHVLGPEPPKVPRLGKPVVHSYSSLPNKRDAMEVQLDLAFPFLCDIELRGTEARMAEDPARKSLLGVLRTTYFCLPANPKYQALRDLAQDRLYKARNNLDINGRPIVYSMTEPSLDPAALFRALGGGAGGLLSLLNDMDGPMPYQRFSFLIAKALELVNELRATGEQFLQVKEKRDAEALMLLKARQDSARQTLVLGLKQLQRDEIALTIESLQQNREAAASQLAYYLQLIGESLDRIPTESGEWVDVQQSIDTPQTDDLRMNRHEAEEMRMASVSAGLHLTASGTEMFMAMLRALPRVITNTEPLGVGVSIKADAENVAEAMGGGVSALRTLAYAASEKGSDAQRKAALTRQLQERRLQANTKGREIKNLDKQIEIQRKRLEIHDRETAIQRLELDHATETEHWYLSKYTNEKLYAWLENSVRAVHYDLYQLAADMARRAERALRFERGGSVPLTSLRPGSYWDASRDGLLAAQQLQLDLRRMEASYLDRPLHDYELTKNISLRQLNPLALLALRERGATTFSLPEVFFDFDFPGHYLRRIRSVSLSLPCVVGPHTSLGATLSLTQHRYRVSAITGGPDDYADEASYPERFRSDRIPLTAVALSTGIQDPGVFELSPMGGGGERFHPFEGAGVISSWRLELPPATRAAFDYATISDVVLHLRYTAVDGGPLLRHTAGQAVDAFRSRVESLGDEGDGGPGLFALFDLRNDLSNEWYAFRAGLEAKARAELDLSELRARLPYWVRGRGVVVTAVSLLVVGPKVKKGDLVVDRFFVPALGTQEWDRTALGKATQLTRAPLQSELAGEGWKLVADNQQGKFTGVENLSLVLRYALVGAPK